MTIPAFAKLHGSWLLDGDRVDVYECEASKTVTGSDICYFAIWEKDGYDKVVTRRRDNLSKVLHLALCDIKSSRRKKEFPKESGVH